MPWTALTNHNRKANTMSCFICNDYHISVLANYAAVQQLTYRHNNKTKEANDAAIIGLILHKENVRSYNYRYDKHLPTTYFTFRYSVQEKPFHESVIISAANCLDYQSCERPDWERSEARAIITAIKARASNAFSETRVWELNP